MRLVLRRQRFATAQGEFMTTGNVESYYLDANHYEQQEGDYKADIQFYVAQAEASCGPVLEIACGTGRITLPIARKGIEIVGLDIAPAMLELARKKADAEGFQIEFVEADCREFSLDRKFPLIICPFSSMQHLYKRESVEAFFARVREHLEPGGRFVFDVFNPNIEILSRGEEVRTPVFNYKNKQTGEEVFVEEESDYDDDAQILYITWHSTSGGSPDIRTENLRMRCFYPQEIDALLHYNGFAIKEKLGAFTGEAFVAGLGKQIFICEAR